MKNQDVKIRIDRRSQPRRGKLRSVSRRSSWWLRMSLALLLFCAAAASGLIARYMPDDSDAVLQHPWTQRICDYAGGYVECDDFKSPPQYEDVVLKDMRFVRFGSTAVFDAYLLNQAEPRPWPVIRLGLLDLSGKSVGNYRLLPRSYLPPDAAPQMTSEMQAIHFSVNSMGRALKYFVVLEAL